MRQRLAESCKTGEPQGVGQKPETGRGMMGEDLGQAGTCGKLTAIMPGGHGENHLCGVDRSLKAWMIAQTYRVGKKNREPPVVLQFERGKACPSVGGSQPTDPTG